MHKPAPCCLHLLIVENRHSYLSRDAHSNTGVSQRSWGCLHFQMVSHSIWTMEGRGKGFYIHGGEKKTTGCGRKSAPRLTHSLVNCRSTVPISYNGSFVLTSAAAAAHGCLSLRGNWLHSVSEGDIRESVTQPVMGAVDVTSRSVTDYWEGDLRTWIPGTSVALRALILLTWR